jgi:hypothetical protein
VLEFVMTETRWAAVAAVIIIAAIFVWLWRLPRDKYPILRMQFRKK